MSEELKTFLHGKGIVTSRSTPYNPRGNGQVERLNSTVWKAITLCLKTKGLPVNRWETVLLDALHSIRSLLCTETNATPHERMFQHSRKSTSGNSLPSWLLTPGPVYLKRHVRNSKYDPIVDEVQLLEANPRYAHVRLPDGRESTVSLRHLAPVGDERQFETNHSCNPSSVEAPDLMSRVDAPTDSPELTSEPDVDPLHQPEGCSHSSETRLENSRPEPFVRTSSYNLRSGPK